MGLICEVHATGFTHVTNLTFPVFQTQFADAMCPILVPGGFETHLCRSVIVLGPYAAITQMENGGADFCVAGSVAAVVRAQHPRARLVVVGVFSRSWRKPEVDALRDC